MLKSTTPQISARAVLVLRNASGPQQNHILVSHLRFCKVAVFKTSRLFEPQSESRQRSATRTPPPVNYQPYRVNTKPPLRLFPIIKTSCFYFSFISVPTTQLLAIIFRSNLNSGDLLWGGGGFSPHEGPDPNSGTI